MKITYMPDPAITIAGVSTLAEQQTQTTSLQLIDDLPRDEGSAYLSGDTGLVPLFRKKATDTYQIATVHDVTGAMALDVAIVDGSGNQITSFGGGTQYTEGDTDSTITGTAIMWETSLDTLWTVRTDRGLPVTLRNGSGTLLGTASVPVQVQIGDGTDQATVSNLGTTKALDVAVMDGSGIQITTFPVSHATLSSLGGTVTAQGEIPGAGAAGIVALCALNSSSAFDHLHLDASGYLQVNVANTPSVTADTELPAAGALAENMSNPTTPLIGSCLMGFDGSTWDRVRSSASQSLHIALVESSATVAVSSATLATEATLASIDADTGNIATAVQLIDDVIATDDGAYSAAGKVAMIGAWYNSTPDTVNSGDAGALQMTEARGLHTHIVTTGGASLLNQTTMSASLPVTTASDQKWAKHATTAVATHSAVTLTSTTEQTSSAVDIDMPRVCVYLSIAKNGSPTRFQLYMQWSDDNSTFYKMDIGPYAIWEYGATEVSGTYTRCFHVPACGRYIKTSIQASGTADGSNYFTVTCKVLGVNP